MRFPLAIRVPFLLVAALATASIVSSLSIPRKLDAELAFVDLAKRGAPPKQHEAFTQSSSAAAAKDPTPHKPAASNPPKSPPAAASSTPASAAAANSTPAPAKNSNSSPASLSAPASSVMSSVPLENGVSATQTGLNASATGTGSTTPVPTGGLSTPAVGGIIALAGVVVAGASIFAVMRYKRKSNLTQNLGTKTNNQYANNSPYGGAAAFPSTNTGYERLSDPQLSGALAPVGASSPPQQQQSLGTFTVISTYTPTLGDELEIQPGDKVTLLVEYDDGWCQGVNESRGRVKGVFPKHCVDLGGGQGGADDMERSKRVSSMYGGGGYRM